MPNPNQHRAISSEGKKLRLLAVRANLLHHPMEESEKIELLKTAYAAFNSRDIDGALAAMAADVAWPRAFEGGFVNGQDEVRHYWEKQWNEIDPTVEPISFRWEERDQLLAEVRLLVRSLDGGVIADQKVGHRFSFKDGQIAKMELAEDLSLH